MDADWIDNAAPICKCLHLLTGPVHWSLIGPIGYIRLHWSLHCFYIVFTSWSLTLSLLVKPYWQ